MRRNALPGGSSAAVAGSVILCMQKAQANPCAFAHVPLRMLSKQNRSDGFAVLAIPFPGRIDPENISIFPFPKISPTGICCGPERMPMVPSWLGRDDSRSCYGQQIFCLLGLLIRDNLDHSGRYDRRCHILRPRFMRDLPACRSRTGTNHSHAGRGRQGGLCVAC